MANGLDLVVPFTGDPDPTLPYASSIDARITPGSLVLVEPPHSRGTWPANPPAAGAVLPNVAWQTAAALIGSGDLASLSGAYATGGTISSATAQWQATPKGGLHGIFSSAARSGARSHVAMAQAIVNYLTANPARAFALFVWGRVTRASPSNSNLNEIFIGNTLSGAANNLMARSIPNVVGAFRGGYSAPTGWTGTPSGTPANNGGGVWGGNSVVYNSLNNSNGKSYILYAYHLVDVLASGLTFAQLDAIDAAAYAEAFGTGGRFAGDTWVDPATIIAT